MAEISSVSYPELHIHGTDAFIGDLKAGWQRGQQQLQEDLYKIVTSSLFGLGILSSWTYITLKCCTDIADQIFWKKMPAVTSVPLSLNSHLWPSCLSSFSGQDWRLLLTTPLSFLWSTAIELGLYFFCKSWAQSLWQILHLQLIYSLLGLRIKSNG